MLEERVQTRRMTKALRIRIPEIYGNRRQSMTKPREAKRLPVRCSWARSELMIRYHDEEWGVPVHDDRKLFEFLILEGAQAGLSWETILNKRDNYRKAFHNFVPTKVARYAARDVKRLLADSGIVRNRLKIASAIANAEAF